MSNLFNFIGKSNQIVYNYKTIKITSHFKQLSIVAINGLY